MRVCTAHPRGRGDAFSTAANGNCCPVSQENGILEPAESTVLSPVAQPGWGPAFLAVMDHPSPTPAAD